VSGISQQRDVSVSLSARGVIEAKGVSLTDVIAVPNLPDLEDSIPTMQDAKNFAYLSSIQFHELESSKVELLIRARVQVAHKVDETREGCGGPVTVHTALGWTLVGAVDRPEDAGQTTVKSLFVCTQTGDVHEHRQRLNDSRFKDLKESAGASAYSVEDLYAVKIMEEVPRKEESMWELGLTQLTPLPPDDRELKKAQKVNAVDIRNVAGKKTVRTLLTYFSSFIRLQHAVAWMNRFKQYLRWKIKGGKSEVQKRGLAIEELVIAESEVVKLVQKESYVEELGALSNHSSFEGLCSSKSVDSLKKSYLKALCPVNVDGILRVGGRLQRSCLPAGTKHPIRGGGLEDVLGLEESF